MVPTINWRQVESKSFWISVIIGYNLLWSIQTHLRNQNSPNTKVCIGLVSLFNGISIFLGYLVPKLFSWENNSGTI